MDTHTERLHGLDAVRGYALMLGVVFHATMSFLPGPQVWPIKDTHPSAVLSVVFFVSHAFRMTAFFLIAGYFARLMVERRGVQGFIKDRLKRIAVPLVVGWFPLFVGILAASAYGVYLATGHVPTKAPPLPYPPPPLAFPLTHLWFLYLLLILYGFALTARWFVCRLDREGRVMRAADRLMRLFAGKRAVALLLGLPSAAALYAYARWLPWFGVPTPNDSLIPNSPALIQFGMAFGVGWLLSRQSDLLEIWSRRWALNVAAGALLIGGCLAWLGLTPVIVPPTADLERLLLAVAYAAGAWTLSLGFTGAALRFMADHSPVRRYIADSSYWIYLIHVPVVMLLQAVVSQLDWPWEAKFGVILGVGFPLMFASYHLLVRRTFVGWVLNGRRIPRPAHSPAPSILPEATR